MRSHLGNTGLDGQGIRWIPSQHNLVKAKNAEDVRALSAEGNEMNVDDWYGS